MPHSPIVLPKQIVTSNQAKWRCSQPNPKVALNLPLTSDEAHLPILVERVLSFLTCVIRQKQIRTQKSHDCEFETLFSTL